MGDGQAPALPCPPARTRCGHRDRLRPGRAARSATCGGPLRRRLPARRRTTGTAPSRRSSSCGASSTPPTATRSCERAFAELWRRASKRGRPRRAAIFAELGARRRRRSRRRQLLESESFRELLLERAGLLREAALTFSRGRDVTARARRASRPRAGAARAAAPPASERAHGPSLFAGTARPPSRRARSGKPLSTLIR